MKNSKDQLLIGAHTSAAGGAYNALLEGKKIGATTIQLFTRNQKQWEAKPLSSDEIAAWEAALEETGIREVMSHDSYLINLGCPKEENLIKSRSAFKAEIERCQQLKLSYLNFHPGAALDRDPQECLDKIVESLLECENLFQDDSLRLLLETTAGQGSTVGHTFEQVGYILDQTKKKIPIGVCIDTCHIFVAGYDIRTPEAWDHTLKEFDKAIGLKNLYAFHVNDSMKGLGSKVDRHQALGEGEIGSESFKFLMTDPRTRNLPKYLETPGGVEQWAKEIPMLRGFAG